MLPVTAVKIDRSFISGMQTDDARAEMVRAIVALAHNLRLAVIAEGVETTEELEALRDLSAEYAQGYLFARPLTAAAASALIASGPERRRTAGAASDRASKPARARAQSASISAG
jgi:EAL domain-containing protein (putative c-di-GMP-specific phosphodiesterase class I)